MDFCLFQIFGGNFYCATFNTVLLCGLVCGRLDGKEMVCWVSHFDEITFWLFSYFLFPGIRVGIQRTSCKEKSRLNYELEEEEKAEC